MKRGSAFEVAVREAVERLLESGDLGLDPDSCELETGKSYPVAGEARSIETDISLEVTVRGDTEPSLIWIWECKDYARPVPISQVRNFHSVLQEIGGGRAKGSMVATNTYQSGAVAYARKHCIGLSTVEDFRGRERSAPVIVQAILGFHLETTHPISSGKSAQYRSVAPGDRVRQHRSLDAAFFAHLQTFVERDRALRGIFPGLRGR